MTKYVFICSASHSGSTLLDLLIGAHTRVSSLGEISQLSKNIALNNDCSCGSGIRSCQVWQEALQRVGAEIGIDICADPYALHMGYPLASRVVDPTRQTPGYLVRRQLLLGLQYAQLRYGLPVTRVLPGLVDMGIANNVRIYEAIRGVLRTDAVVDSSKSYLKAVALYLSQPEHTRILLLTRDGRGVLWSYIKKGVAREKGLREWRTTYSRAMPLLRRHVPQEHCLRVRYEDLTSDTSGVLRSICEFIDLPFEQSMLDYRRKTHHIVNGNRMRLSSSSAIRADVEWQTRLSPGDQRFFERQAGALNRALGYG